MAATLSADETGRRAAGGAGLLVARGALVLLVGLGANVLLARLLDPRDFGLVALGSVLLVFGGFFADVGLGAALVRRGAPPSRKELECLNGVQLGVTAALAAGAAAVAGALGGDAWVVAAMVASLPIAMLRVPSGILLERSLDYRVIAKVDLLEAGAFYAWAVGTVALGAGVWGFATAVLVRAAVGAGAMLRLGPLGLVRPRWSWAVVRPLLGFAAKFQTAVVIALVRDQALNLGIAAVAGVAALGVWNLAWRVLQIPSMVFGNIGRVGFPAMARLLEAGQDPRPVLERGGAALAVLSGTMMVGLTGFAPALPVLLGPRWHDLPAILLWAGMALIASFPVVVSVGPYLFAVDCGGTVVSAALLGAAVWLALGLSLLTAVGPAAIAVGWCAGVLVQAPLLVRGAAARSGAAMAARIGLPACIGIAAAACGWLVADAAGRTIGAGILGAALGEALLLAALAAFRRAAVRDARRFVAQALRNIVGRSAQAAPRART
jgi:O-antigen/teichoic acid export membrane protein